MSLMERVREVGAEQAHIDEGTVAGVRGALMREIAHSGPAARDRRRMPRWAGIGIGGVVAGAATVTAIVVGSVVAPIPAAVPTASAAVAAVMNNMAEVTIHAADTTLQPGQFLKIVDTRNYLTTDNQVRGGDVTTSAYRHVVTDVVYVPADRTDDWIVDATAPIEITSEWGAGASQLRRSVMSDSSLERQAELVRLPGSRLTDNPYLYYSAAEFAAMPRDPEQLIEWMRTKKNARGGESLAILNALHMGLAPADLRAALFKALALIPGWEITDKDGPRVTLTRSLPEEGWQSFVVDTDSGMIVKVIDSPWQIAGTLLPSHEPGMVETFTTTVVSTAP